MKHEHGVKCTHLHQETVQSALQTLDTNQIKNQIGFGTAFKVTMGFYAAQFVATILGLFTIGLVLGTLLLIFKAVL